MNQPALLSFRLTKRFSGFSLECEGDFDSGVTAIFGPSGSGKTTLLSCVAGLMRPDEGAIEVLGTTVYSSSSRKNVPPESRRLGYVLQDAALFPHMTVRDNVMYGYRLTAEDRRHTDPEDLVRLFRLAPLLDRRVENLSGGEQQRVALARALATSPRLLLLDEPLASLDAGFRGVIIEYLRRIRRDLKTPMLYVSHSISEVMALSDAILVLKEGRRAAYGRTSQVLVRPEVAEMADGYAALENLLEAEVVSLMAEEGLSELKVGHKVLTSPAVSRAPGETVTVSIGAGDVILALDIPPRTSARNVVEGTIEAIHVVGLRVLVYADIGARLVVEITRGSLRQLDLREGQRVYLIIKTNSIVVMDAPE